MLNLDNLLGNDQLSPAQQRAVRKHITYAMKRTGMYAIPYSFRYNVKNEKPQKLHTFEFDTLSFETKQLMYKEVMFILIYQYARFKTHHPAIIVKVKRILKKGIFDRDEYNTQITFGSQDYLDVPYFGFIRSQNLFQALQLLEGES